MMADLFKFTSHLEGLSDRHPEDRSEEPNCPPERISASARSLKHPESSTAPARMTHSAQVLPSSRPSTLLLHAYTLKAFIHSNREHNAHQLSSRQRSYST